MSNSSFSLFSPTLSLMCLCESTDVFLSTKFCPKYASSYASRYFGRIKNISILFWSNWESIHLIVLYLYLVLSCLLPYGWLACKHVKYVFVRGYGFKSLSKQIVVNECLTKSFMFTNLFVSLLSFEQICHFHLNPY